MSLQIERLSQVQIAEYLPQLADLRITVFKEFPYLYQGSVEYEEEYLRTYVRAESAMLVLAKDGEKAIGMSSCLCLAEEIDELQEPFKQMDIDPSNVFYFGESVLLPAHRGKGIGKLFFKEREDWAQKVLGQRLKLTAFCAVNRPENHPLRPQDYKPLDAFWSKLGYQKHPDLMAELCWRELGKKEETKNPLTFWTKRWS